MKSLLILMAIAVSTLTATGQRKNELKAHHSKIKNGNVLLVPDQKPVIIERREDPVIVKPHSVNHKNNLPPGQAKKLYKAKSARPFTSGKRKKAVLSIKNKRL